MPVFRFMDADLLPVCGSLILWGVGADGTVFGHLAGVAGEKGNEMRMLTGAVLLAAAEQAYSHAHLIGFPHGATAKEVLLPTSLVFVGGGLAFLIWGIITERK